MEPNVSPLLRSVRFLISMLCFVNIMSFGCAPAAHPQSAHNIPFSKYYDQIFVLHDAPLSQQWLSSTRQPGGWGEAGMLDFHISRYKRYCDRYYSHTSIFHTPTLLLFWNRLLLGSPIGRGGCVMKVKKP